MPHFDGLQRMKREYENGIETVDWRGQTDKSNEVLGRVGAKDKCVYLYNRQNASD